MLHSTSTTRTCLINTCVTRLENIFRWRNVSRAFLSTHPLSLRSPRTTDSSLCNAAQHFHYSYVLNIAAVLAHLRPEWATAENKNWVETLIRDVNNPNKVRLHHRSDRSRSSSSYVHHDQILFFTDMIFVFRPEWATVENKNWVETLNRDFNSPNKVRLHHISDIYIYVYINDLDHPSCRTRSRSTTLII